MTSPHLGTKRSSSSFHPLAALWHIMQCLRGLWDQRDVAEQIQSVLEQLLSIAQRAAPGHQTFRFQDVQHPASEPIRQAQWPCAQAQGAWKLKPCSLLNPSTGAKHLLHPLLGAGSDDLQWSPPIPMTLWFPVLTNLARRHIQNTSQQVSQGAVLIQLLLGAKHSTVTRHCMLHAHAAPYCLTPAHLPLWLQAAGAADLLHIVGREPQLLLATIIPPPPGGEGRRHVSTHWGPQVMLAQHPR